DVEPEQRLGIRGAQVETPVVELDADAVDVLDPLRTRRVLLLDAPHRRRGVFDAPVDLAARRKERHPFLDELGKLGAALAHDLREQQPRNHAAVGIRETAEIVMRAHLAAVDRVDLAHRLLDERMAGLALHGLAAGALDEIDRAPREPRIVHDRLAGILLEETHREEPDDVVALDERAFLVEEEAAVEVAVPCETEIRAGLADLLDRHDAVALDHRIRHAVRERAVRRVMELHELERQVRLEQVHDRARAAVAGVHDDLQGLQRLAIDVAQQVLDVRRPDVDRLARAFALGLAERLALRDRLDVLEAGIGADRPRLLADHLHAVVVRRIVARGDHDAAVELLVESGEVDDLGADDA